MDTPELAAPYDQRWVATQCAGSPFCCSQSNGRSRVRLTESGTCARAPRLGSPYQELGWFDGMYPHGTSQKSTTPPTGRPRLPVSARSHAATKVRSCIGNKCKFNFGNRTRNISTRFFYLLIRSIAHRSPEFVGCFERTRLHDKESAMRLEPSNQSETCKSWQTYTIDFFGFFFGSICVSESNHTCRHMLATNSKFDVWLCPT